MANTDSPTMTPDNRDRQSFFLREDCGESGTGFFWNPDRERAGICHEYTEFTFQMRDDDFYDTVEQLERDSDSHADRINEIVFENSELRQKVQRLENEMERMMEQQENFSRKFMKEMKELKSRGCGCDDQDGDEDNEERRECNGVEWESSCYELSEDDMDYEEAESHCERQGGRLASWSSDSQEVHKRLLEYQQEQGFAANVNYWIGVSYDTKSDRSLWSDGRVADIKLNRFNKLTACGAIYKKFIAGFKCSNEYRAWCQFDDMEM